MAGETLDRDQQVKAFLLSELAELEFGDYATFYGPSEPE